jgi:microcystin-dependent protein
MSVPFIGQIKLFAGTFAPLGWSFCNGSLMQISQNDALFALIGTTYGGDGINTFALPDLRGRVAVHQGTLAGGSTYTMGQSAGAESVTLTPAQLPQHSHGPLPGNDTGGSDVPLNNIWGKSTTGKCYAPPPPPGVLVALNSATVENTGGSQPHDNMHPFQCINYIIALDGVFPSQQ